MTKVKAELLITSTWEAERVVDALIHYERALRRKGVGPWSRLAWQIKVTRRKLQEDAGLVMTHSQVEQLLQREGRKRPQ